jgi:hypothetical protein
MVQSRPEAHSLIKSLCVKHTPLNKQRRESLLERKSLLGCLSHFGHLPNLNLVPPKLYPIKEAVPTKESDH